jgi:hypothetical protein
MEAAMRIVISTIVALAVVLGVAPAIGAQARNLTDAVVCNDEADRRAGIPSASPGAGDKPRTLTPEPGTRTDPSGSIVAESRDPLLEGMAAEGLTDPAYRTAYRDCMAARARRSH